MTETRPQNCRERLREEGKSYPRSSCSACGWSIGSNSVTHCGGVIDAPPDTQSPAPTTNVVNVSLNLGDLIPQDYLADMVRDATLGRTVREAAIRMGYDPIYMEPSSLFNWFIGKLYDNGMKKGAADGYPGKDDASGD